MMHDHPHPGELLREDVLVSLGIDVTEAAHRFWMNLQSNYELSLAAQRKQPDILPLQPAPASTS